MPKAADYRVAWSVSARAYHVQQTRDQAVLTILPDSLAWFDWLEQVTSLAFRGQRGHFTARKERRARGESYWYAYVAAGEKLRKTYLGKSSEVTLARLEEVAARLLAQDLMPPGPLETPASPNPVSRSETARVARWLAPLPVPPTPILGREREIGAACTLLMRPEVQLLTLTGTAGVGKTRLALAIATKLQEDFADGVSLVSLAPIRDPDLVLPAIAEALGLPSSRTRPPLERLQVALLERQVLLVLDNFEQVVMAAPLLVELLAACPGLTVLVTSREVLHVRGEREFQVLPLALPDPTYLPDPRNFAGYGAIALFLERAQDSQPTLQLTDEMVPLIVAICRRLDGLPLAIELAAARLKLLSLPALLERLEHRLAVLTGGPRDLPARQHTLRATISWSYDLLSDEERRLFRWLSVFVEGCTLEAVEQVVRQFGDESIPVLDGVSSLLNKHLLSRAERDTNAPRFVMLETLREYGLEALAGSGEMEAARLAHATYYLTLAEETESHLFGNEQKRWFDPLEREHDNLRAAMRWSVESGEDGQRREVAWRLVGVLKRLWTSHGYVREWQQFIERVLERDEGITAPVRAKALDGALILAIWLGEYERAEALCQESLELYRALHDPRGMAGVLEQLGWVASARGDPPLATSLLEESVALAREVGDTVHLAFSLTALALTTLRHADQSRYPQVRSLLEESLALCREESFQPGIAWSLYGLGLWHFQQGDAPTVRALFEESLTLYRALRAPIYICYVLYFLGKVAAVQGDFSAAYALYRETLASFQEVDDQQGVTACLEGWARVAARQGAATWAAQLWGAAEVRREASGPFDFFTLFTLPGERADNERMRDEVRTHLGEQAFAQAIAKGHAMTPEHALAAGEVTVLSRPPSARAGADQPGVHAPAPNDLTEREREVLRLVAQGLTDSQVAERLIISPRTVNAHLRSIYGKLGVNSRHAATVFAFQHHLT